MFSTCCKLHKINRLLPSTLFTPKFCISLSAHGFGFELSPFLVFGLFTTEIFFFFNGLFSQWSVFHLNTFLKATVLKIMTGKEEYSHTVSVQMLTCRIMQNFVSATFIRFVVSFPLFIARRGGRLSFSCRIIRQKWRPCVINWFLPYFAPWYNFSRLCIIVFPVPLLYVLSLSYCHWRLIPPSVIGDVLLLDKGVGAAQGNSADIYFINLFLLFLHLLQL